MGTPAGGDRASIADWIGVAVIVATAFLYNGWLLNARTFFFADDWQWLYYAEFVPWGEYLAVFPVQLYNDRPVGGAFIKALYQIFGLNHFAFQLVLLIVHAINCVLVYRIANRYVGFAGALLTALLSATWFSTLTAVGWSAAIFDLFGATLCLSVVRLRQRAIESGNNIRYDLIGAACYLLAIRTKEFAIGLVFLLLLMNMIAERQRVRATLQQLLPYLIVFGVYAVWYSRLVLVAPVPGIDPYALNFSIPTVVASLGFQVSTAFYEKIIGVTGVMLVIFGLGVGLAAASADARRIAVFGFAGFVILLGPTLLLATNSSTGYHALYLYTPHFFLALVIGALVTRAIVPTVVAIAISLLVLITPNWVHYRQDVVGFYVSVGERSAAQFHSALRLLSPLPQGATIYISGLPTFLNPFAAGPGKSLMTAFKDPTINVVVEKPDAELLAMFCEQPGPKRFLRFAGKEGAEVTAEIQRRCVPAGEQ